jgi:FR47-like protein
VPEILDLVERTKPGPFLKRTIELGAYLGIRRDGRLIAMAGEQPVLHVAAANTGAILLYERLGFAVRTPVVFGDYRDPSTASAAT